MKNQSPVLGIPVINVSFADHVLPGEPEAAAAAAATENDGLILCDDCKQDIGMINHKDSVVSDWMARFRVKANKRVQGIREYVNSGPSISQSLKGKLSFFKTVGVERVFRKAFSIKGKEKLLKSFQCYLSTTTGPISGMLFISTERIAFLSNTSLQLTSHYGEITRFRYKVMIPLARIKNAIPIDNLDMPKGKYIQIVTVDEFDFWFMGFVHYQNFFNNFQKTIPGPR